MSSASELFLARAQLYLSRPTSASIRYVRENGLYSADRVGRGLFYRDAGLCVRDRFGSSDLADTLVAIVEGFGRDGQTVLDLVAWPIDDPRRVFTAFGRLPLLGMPNLFSAATFAFDRPLRCYRTPLAWWRAGCMGAVVLDEVTAPRLLLDSLGTISGEDFDHSCEIAELVQGSLTLRVSSLLLQMKGARHESVRADLSADRQGSTLFV